TVVTIHLPLQVGPRNEHTAPPKRRAAAPGVRILVAEDEPALRRLVCTVLRADGYEVVEAEDGAAAVALVASDRGALALAILDVRMPALSGPAAYARMVQHRAGLPRLFVTGHA